MKRAFKPEKEYTKEALSFFAVVLSGSKPSSPFSWDRRHWPPPLSLSLSLSASIYTCSPALVRLKKKQMLLVNVNGKNREKYVKTEKQKKNFWRFNQYFRNEFAPKREHFNHFAKI